MTAIIRPHDRYLMDLEKPDFRADPAQALAIKKLDNLFDRLLAQQDLSLKDKGLSLVNRSITINTARAWLIFLGRCWARQNLFNGYVF